MARGTGAHLRVEEFGDNAQGVRLLGDPRKPEHATFIVEFPGGFVEISRTTGGAYWVHASAWSNNDAAASDGEKLAGRVVDQRTHPNHLAVRIETDRTRGDDR